MAVNTTCTAVVVLVVILPFLPLILLTVVEVCVVLTGCGVLGNTTDVVLGMTDGHTSSINCTTAPAVV